VGTLESEGGTHQGGPERVPLVGIPEVSGPRVGRSGEGGFRQDLDNHGAYIPVAFTQNQRDEVRGLGGLSGALAAQPGVHQQTYVAQPVAYSVAVRGREDGQEWELGEAEVGNALRAGDGGSSRGNWALVPEEDPGRGTPLVPVCPGGDTSKSYWKPADIANTVTSGNFPYQGTRIAYPNMAVRRLTPLECARLQGYPDDWLDGLGLSDSTKYRQLGNSIAVPVVAWIAARLVAAAE
jgi:DNA (cytosine-5)-methyltransferase 1